jgi:hypothetical protein
LLIDLQLQSFSQYLRTKQVWDKTYVWDVIRKKWLVLQPEELVRQLLVHYLINEKRASVSRMAIEKVVQVNTLQQRFDLVVYDRDFQPFMLIECKAPAIPISDDVFEQISRYNKALKTPYLLVTNGLDSYCCKVNYDDHRIDFMEQVPFC